MNNCNWCVSLDIAYILALILRDISILYCGSGGGGSDVRLVVVLVDATCVEVWTLLCCCWWWLGVCIEGGRCQLTHRSCNRTINCCAIVELIGDCGGHVYIGKKTTALMTDVLTLLVVVLTAYMVVMSQRRCSY